MHEASGFGDIGDEEILVALAARDFGKVEGVESDEPGEFSEEFEQAEAGCMAAADIEGVARCGVAVGVGGVVERDEVVCMEHVADLFAGAGDGELRQRLSCIGGGFLLDGFLAEPSDPALIERGELASSVDRRVAEDNRLQPVNAAPVVDILVGRAFGTAVWGGEIERQGFIQSGRKIGEVVAGGEFLVAEVLQVAVNFVGRAVCD